MEPAGFSLGGTGEVLWLALDGSRPAPGSRRDRARRIGWKGGRRIFLECWLICHKKACARARSQPCATIKTRRATLMAYLLVSAFGPVAC